MCSDNDELQTYLKPSGGLYKTSVGMHIAAAATADLEQEKGTGLAGVPKLGGPRITPTNVRSEFPENRDLVSG